MPGIIFLCKIIQISKDIMLGLGKIKDLGINKMLSKKQKVKRFFTKIFQNSTGSTNFILKVIDI